MPDGTMVELGWAANVAEIVGASTVVIAVVLGWIEIRQARRERKRKAALDQTRLSSMDWARAVASVWQLPDDVPSRELAEDFETLAAANFVAMGINETAHMLHQEVIQPEDTEGMNWRPVCRVSWRKLRRFVRGTRIAADDEMLFHWFERWAVDLGEEPLEEMDYEAPGASDPGESGGP